MRIGSRTTTLRTSLFVGKYHLNLGFIGSLRSSYNDEKNAKKEKKEYDAVEEEFANKKFLEIGSPSASLRLIKDLKNIRREGAHEKLGFSANPVKEPGKNLYAPLLCTWNFYPKMLSALDGLVRICIAGKCASSTLMVRWRRTCRVLARRPLSSRCASPRTILSLPPSFALVRHSSLSPISVLFIFLLFMVL